MPTTLCRISFSIPEDLYLLYEQDAKDVDKTVEEIIIKRLHTCRGHNASRPLYFDDKQRGRLEAMTGGRILTDADAAIRRLENQASIRLDNTKVAIKPTLLTRLKSRCGRNQPFPEFVKKQAIEGLERYAMMR